MKMSFRKQKCPTYSLIMLFFHHGLQKRWISKRHKRSKEKRKGRIKEKKRTKLFEEGTEEKEEELKNKRR